MTPAERRRDTREDFDSSKGPVDLTGFSRVPDAVDRLAEPIVRALKCVPLVLDDGVLVVGMSAAPSADRLAALRELTGTEVEVIIATSESIDALVADLFGSGRRGPDAL